MKQVLHRSLAIAVSLVLVLLLLAADIPSREPLYNNAPDWSWAADGFSIARTTYLIGEPVIFTYKNNTGEVVELPGGAPWTIEDAEGNEVLNPISTMILIYMQPGQATGWTWDQKDNEGVQVAAGTYSVVLRTSADTPRATFTIGAAKGTGNGSDIPSLPDLRPFTDVSGSVEGDSYIFALYDMGIVKGKGEDIFAPDAAVTKAEFLAMLLRAFGVEPAVANDLEANPEPFYEDVPQDHWSFGYVTWATQMGYLNDVVEDAAGDVDPDTSVSSAASSKPASHQFFGPDDLIAGSAVSRVVLSAAGSEVSIDIASAESITRREACAVIYNLLEK